MHLNEKNSKERKIAYSYRLKVKTRKIGTKCQKRRKDARKDVLYKNRTDDVMKLRV